MTFTLIFFVLTLAILQLFLPFRLAFLPLILAGLHLGNVEVLPELTPARTLILLGLGRALFSGKLYVPNLRSTTDKLFILFSISALLSTLGHEPDDWIPSPFSARAGLVLNVAGTYLYSRTYIRDIGDLLSFSRILIFALAPLSVLLTVEQKTQRNFYSALGSHGESTMVREGRARASGPFRHPILAGTAGATAIPFALLLWRNGSRTLGALGATAALGIVMASASSGPLAAVAVALASIPLWRLRTHVAKLLWFGLIIAFLYILIRGRGPWYLMASLDLVGGSTGWHRAKLMDQAFLHMTEWWLWGTDYTRHWMASGTRSNPNHVDLTNYYIHLGVIGGLPLLTCLVFIILISMRDLSRSMSLLRQANDHREFYFWTLGVALVTHAFSFVSISYFDQMYIYFYFLIGLIATTNAQIFNRDSRD